MKKLLWAFLMMLLISTGSSAQSQKADKKSEPSMSNAKGGSVDQVLMDIERKWTATDLKSDSAGLAEILADSWSGINTEGKVESRAERLDSTKKSKLTRSEVSDMKVRMINPDAAVVTGLWAGAGTDAKGQKFDRTERWMDVFAKQGSAWKCVASESTVVQK